ncbi:MAG: hypothetical protein V1847_00570 [Candidatus Diapherotrites archaeon]
MKNARLLIFTLLGVLAVVFVTGCVSNPTLENQQNFINIEYQKWGVPDVNILTISVARGGNDAYIDFKEATLDQNVLQIIWKKQTTRAKVNAFIQKAQELGFYKLNNSYIDQSQLLGRGWESLIIDVQSAPNKSIKEYAWGVSCNIDKCPEIYRQVLAELKNLVDTAEPRQ